MPDVKTLPKWGQALIEGLRRTLSEREREIEQLRGQGRVAEDRAALAIGDVFRGARQEALYRLPVMHTRVRWEFANQQRRHIEAYCVGDLLTGGMELRVYGSDGVLIHPTAGNCFTVKLEG